jgi:general stress protein 26
MNDQCKAKILAVLASQKLAVISTVSPTNSTPESALIAFTEDSELCLYFQTGKHTRKAANLKLNPHVSLVIGLSLKDSVTLQYEGTAEKLVAAKDLESCKERFITKNSPTTEEYFNHPAAIFFKVSPTWIGYSDYSSEEPEVIEIKNFS